MMASRMGRPLLTGVVVQSPPLPVHLSKCPYRPAP